MGQLLLGVGLLILELEADELKRLWVVGTVRLGLGGDSLSSSHHPGRL